MGEPRSGARSWGPASDTEVSVFTCRVLVADWGGGDTSGFGAWRLKQDRPVLSGRRGSDLGIQLCLRDLVSEGDVEPSGQRLSLFPGLFLRDRGF